MITPEYASLYQHLVQQGQSDLAQTLKQHLDFLLDTGRHGDWHKWALAVQQLPELQQIEAQLQNPACGLKAHCHEPELLREGLLQLHPWRKGPFQIADVVVDAEWRSDWKWQRIEPLLPDLQGQHIIDIGSGNGYYLLRMLGLGAASVLGVDPSPLTCWQFESIKRYLPELAGWVFPAGIEQLPPGLEYFDMAFSMGVLYHRKSPIDHLQELAGLVKSGGYLLLETLIIEGDEQQVLVPKGRYARMRNVWFIPSTAALSLWLQRCGWRVVAVGEEYPTLPEEQRSTEWMRFESLPQCLNADNPELTVEGYPAPKRVAILAQKA